MTDHKTIYGNRTSNTSARIERWVLRLQQYSFTIKYKPGRKNPADCQSRHPTSTSLKQQRMTEAHIDMIVRASVPKTNSDNTLRAVRAAIKMNKWHYDSVKSFKAFKDELTVTHKVTILRGTRIVMPHTLQQRAIDLAHTSHLGETKTKGLIRFMQPLAKALKTAKIDQHPWKKELQRFLLQYRTTPHCLTGVPPAELLFNRTVQANSRETQSSEQTQRSTPE